MGLMDREYMNRTPEERQAQNSEYQKHQLRLKEMNSLHAKGNSLTAKEKRRLEEIYELNRQYMSTGKTTSNKVHAPKVAKKKNHYLPLLIFTLAILALVFVLTYYPELLGV